MQYLAKRDSPSPKVLAFRTRMNKPDLNLSEPNLSALQDGVFHPHKHGNWAQWVAAFIAGFLLLLGLFNTVLTLYFHHSEGQSKALDDHVNALMDTKLDPIVKRIDDKLDSIIKRLDDLERRVSTIEGQLRETSSNVPFKQLMQKPVQYAPAIERKVADALKVGKTSLNPTDVQRAGGTLLNAADGEGDIWSAAQACLDYVSFWNSQKLALPPAKGKSKYQVKVKPDSKRLLTPVLYAGDKSSASKSALLDSLDNPHPRGSGFSYLIVDGNKNSIILDSMRMKHVILRNADLQYGGGPVQFEDVYFVNCTFTSGFAYNGNSVELGHEILKAVAPRPGKTKKAKLSKQESISYSVFEK